MNPLGQMIFDDGKAAGLTEGRAEGRALSVIDMLSDLGTVASDLTLKIMSENDDSVLRRWLKLAAHAQSIDEFQSAM